MKRFIATLVGLASLVLPASRASAGPPPFALKDGERIVLLGDTLIERDQKYGYLETLLTAANPGKSLIFRNLGWSGDTVFGEARAGFGTQADGFRQLKEHVLGLKPTVILVGYGMNESFEGEPGLSKFVKGLNALLDVLAETKARIVLIPPIRHEDLGRPLPDPTKHNQAIDTYTKAIATVAAERGCVFVDLAPLYDSKGGASGLPLTDDGIHLTEYGYRRFAGVVCAGLRWYSLPWGIAFEDGDKTFEEGRIEVSKVEVCKHGLVFEAKAQSLPAPFANATPSAPGEIGQLEAKLPEGRYVLKIDGKPVTTASSSAWAKGVPVLEGPDLDQLERLRKVINEKNLLYFHRWRPQNETYLFGFRKHEQGNNAVEIPQFDPLVDAKEKAIAKLRVPATHVYDLVRESEVSK